MSHLDTMSAKTPPRPPKSPPRLLQPIEVSQTPTKTLSTTSSMVQKRSQTSQDIWQELQCLKAEVRARRSTETTGLPVLDRESLLRLFMESFWLQVYSLAWLSCEAEVNLAVGCDRYSLSVRASTCTGFSFQMSGWWSLVVFGRGICDFDGDMNLIFAE